MKINFMFFVLMWVIGCSTKGAERIAYNNPAFNLMKNISAAPAHIRVAARAVVRIRLDKGAGTGSFVSADGLLMTNNHVLGLGDQLCAREGCRVYLAFDLQDDLKVNEVTAFAEPLAVGVEGDVSFFQIWTSPEKTEKLSTPNFLEIVSVSAEELQGSDLHIIGHPQANLKKWVQAKAVSYTGHFATLAALIVGGNSGSPVLNAQMKVVGIVHHARLTQADYSRHGVVTEGDMSDSREILRVQSLGNAAIFPSVIDPRSSSWVVENQSFYLSAGQTLAAVEGRGLVSVPQLLGEACDAALARKAFRSIEDFAKVTLPCREISIWFSCLTPTTTKQGQYCPEPEEADVWRDRIHKLYKMSTRYNVKRSLGDLTYLAFLESQMPYSSEFVKEALINANMPFSHNLLLQAIALTSTAVRINKRSAVWWVRNYRSVLNYEADYQSIAGAYTRVYAAGEITAAEAKAFFRRALADPKISLLDFLAIEEMAYLYGLL